MGHDHIRLIGTEFYDASFSFCIEHCLSGKCLENEWNYKLISWLEKLESVPYI